MKQLIPVLVFMLTSLCVSSIKLSAQFFIADDAINVSALVQAGNSSGSGFFIQDSVEIFFVTARHVIMVDFLDPISKQKSYRLISPIIELKWYPRQAEKSNSNSMIIDVLKLNSSGGLKYGLSEQDDYVIMRIGKIEKRTGYSAIIYSSSITRPGASSKLNGFPLDLCNPFDKIEIGSDVFMVGYPKSLGLKNIPQYDFNRPLLRKGIVAGKDVVNSNIIIDCSSYQGNSGGVVYEISGNQFQPELKLIGIVSSFIPFAEVWTNQNYGVQNMEIANSGYSVIIPIEKAISQISVIRKNKFQ